MLLRGEKNSPKRRGSDPVNDLRLAQEDALVALKTIKSRQPVGAVERSGFPPGWSTRFRKSGWNRKKRDVWLFGGVVF